MPGSEVPIFSVEELGLDKIQLFSPSSKSPFLTCSFADELSADTIPEKPILALNTIAVEKTPIPTFLTISSSPLVRLKFTFSYFYICLDKPDKEPF
ncbi:hypothetical protein LQK80_02910 [Bacillus thuringiensis]|nr:hypothetical protein [Bacillus thuringiensis]